MIILMEFDGGGTYELTLGWTERFLAARKILAQIRKTCDVRRTWYKGISAIEIVGTYDKGIISVEADNTTYASAFSEDFLEVLSNAISTSLGYNPRMMYKRENIVGEETLNLVWQENWDRVDKLFQDFHNDPKITKDIVVYPLERK